MAGPLADFNNSLGPVDRKILGKKFVLHEKPLTGASENHDNTNTYASTTSTGTEEGSQPGGMRKRHLSAEEKTHTQRKLPRASPNTSPKETYEEHQGDVRSPPWQRTTTGPPYIERENPTTVPKISSPSIFPSFIQAVRDVLTTQLPSPTPTAFRFEMSEEAAAHNWNVFRESSSLKEVIANNKHSPLYYGSEFRPKAVLAPLLSRFPLWPRFADILDNGFDYPTDPIPENERKADLLECLTKGNGKGARENPSLLEELTNDDVTKGFCLPIPTSKVTEIEGAMMAPLNIQTQNTINERGEIIEKDRLTHNQSWEGRASRSSVNSRVRVQELQECKFGKMLLRTVHYIVHLRQRHPTKRIFLQKTDFKSAYRRCHLNWRSAIQSITQAITKKIAFIALRLTFGGRPCPYGWCILSETITDLANELLHCPDWDPKELHSPLQHIIPPPAPFADDIPFGQALPMSVFLPPDDAGKADCYIDDVVTVILDDDENVARGAAAVPLAIHLCGRPVDPHEPIPRNELTAISKLIAEGGLTEDKMVLGWLLDCRRLAISLPFDKHQAWTRDIQRLIDAKQASSEEIDTLIGRLTHVGTILPFIFHFLSRLRSLAWTAAKRRHPVPIPSNQIADLHLMLTFLNAAHKGVDMNLLTFRLPTHFYVCDACEHGFGGFSLEGHAYQYIIPPDLQGRASINLLEFLAQVVAVWIDIFHNRLPPLSCTLCIGDSTTAEGWLHKTNFVEDSESPEHQTAKLIVARLFATLCFENKIRNYTAGQLQHLSSSARDRLLGLLAFANDSRQQADTAPTNAKRALAWKRWQLFLASIELQHDPFLDDFSIDEQQRFLGAFAVTMRQAEWSPGASSLAGETVRDTIDSVAQTFVDNGRTDPKLDAHGKLARLLSKQYKAYKNDDPGTKQQKAINCAVLEEVHRKKHSERAVAIGQLVYGAFFFAMRSCEYSKVSNKKNARRTKLLRLRNLRFFFHGQELPLDDSRLHLADYMSITFEFQKNEERNDTVNHHRTDDPNLCPIRSWAAIVQRILSYPDATVESTVNTYWDEGKLQQVTSHQVLLAIRQAVRDIGEASLGYTADDVGTHSIRSGAAMAMYLDEIPVYSIMMMGRWSSDAFLRYIRKQVEMFSHNVAQRMIKNRHFYTVPNWTPRTSRHDSQQPNSTTGVAAAMVTGGAATRQRVVHRQPFNPHA